MRNNDTSAVIEQARVLGLEAGRAAASWTYDGNTPDAWYSRTLQGIEDGDPAVLDQFDPPNLSGEWADGATPHSLASQLEIDDETEEGEELLGDCCTAWEDGAREGFWGEVERVCRLYAGAAENKDGNGPTGTVSGYTHCACRDCMEIAISSDVRLPELCEDCEEAGCDPQGLSECDVPPDGYDSNEVQEVGNGC